jgi:hypothetical protein
MTGSSHEVAEHSSRWRKPCRFAERIRRVFRFGQPSHMREMVGAHHRQALPPACDTVPVGGYAIAATVGTTPTCNAHVWHGVGNMTLSAFFCGTGAA